MRGEMTAAELRRELGVARSLIQRWKYLLIRGGETAVASDDDVVPASELRAAQQRIRDLLRALGLKQMAIGISEAAQDEVKKAALVRRVETRTEHPVRVICETLGISRATAYRPLTTWARHSAKADDRAVAAQITTVVRERASDGYRRVTAVVNRSFGTRYNRKRIRRVMSRYAWTLPRLAKRRGTRAHRGTVARPRRRRCSD